ncbi:hypothetical protein [Salinicola sp. RZ23]|uniref:hypothetical protein n=1 Tax=Salinicola sp. RZ23 TaxID=1949087 RepID=UPI0013004EBD|nr:hypothetical protein [Salinicola sp. RZ23]
MSDEKIKAIVDSLVGKTESGLVAWKEVGGTLKSNSFKVSFPKSTVIIEDISTDNMFGVAIARAAMPSYRVSVLNWKGEEVDGAKDTELNGAPQGLNLKPNEYTDKLAKLFEMARRQAMGVDDTLDDILKELNSREF